MANPYPYNDDLLTTPEDRAQAAASFGAVARALYFPELVKRFQHADSIANASKREMRRRGLWSVGLVTIALVIASAAPQYHHYHWLSVSMMVTSAVAGIIGGLVGIGLGSSRYKMQWLEERLVTESLRQLHFRLLLSLAPDIITATTSGRWETFEGKRIAALGAFDQNVLKRKADVLQIITDKPEQDPIVFGTNFPDAVIFGDLQGEQLLAAYQELRILRQRQYAEHKLSRRSGAIWTSPMRQVIALSIAAFTCVGVLFLLHIASAGMLTWDEGDQIGPWLHVAAVWTAFVALALRALEEGLKPRAEVERYRHYHLTARRADERYRQSDAAGKIATARSFENEATDEMALFLRANAEARFSI
jgi:MFS family permease